LSRTVQINSLHRMIKIQFNLDILLILRNRFSTSELELLNQASCET
jgi:hypothetical protein